MGTQRASCPKSMGSKHLAEPSQNRIKTRSVAAVEFFGLSEKQTPQPVEKTENAMEIMEPKEALDQASHVGGPGQCFGNHNVVRLAVCEVNGTRRQLAICRNRRGRRSGR